MPRSILLGRPWPQPGEPLWLQGDLDAALSWLHEQRAKCGACGHHYDETTDRDVEWSAEAVRCHACTEIERKQGQMARENVKYPHALRWVVRRVT